MTNVGHIHINLTRVCECCNNAQKEAFPYGVYDPSGRYWETLCNECFDALGCAYIDSDAAATDWRELTAADLESED